MKLANQRNNPEAWSFQTAANEQISKRAEAGKVKARP